MAKQSRSSPARRGCFIRPPSPAGRELIDIYLATGASLASQEALWLLPEGFDGEAVPVPLETDPVALIRAAASLLSQLPDGATCFVPGLVADVCDLVRDCRAL